MRLIDTHCHLDLYPDYEAVLDEIEHNGIYTIAVTNTPSVFSHCDRLTRGARFARTALGLHPELAAAREGEMHLFYELLPKTRYVGEVGLDYVSQNHAERAAQRRVFNSVLESCAVAGDKVLTVHSRRASVDVISMLGGAYPGTVILHWFSGPLSVIDAAIAQGCFFSVNVAMLTSAAGRRIVAALPQERILTETDGPFVKVNGRPARPTDIRDIVLYLAKLWSLDTTAAAQRIHQNFRMGLIDGTPQA